MLGEANTLIFILMQTTWFGNGIG